MSTKEKDCVTSLRDERAKARWSILRNVLIEKTRSLSSAETTTTTHSIHRFPGYQLLERRPVDDTKSLFTSLQYFKWDSQQSLDANVDGLAVACFAFSAAFPTGKAMKLHDSPPITEWIDILKSRCESTISIVSTEYKESVLLLIQEKPKATKFAVYEYVLDDKYGILTREPRQSRLSLNDLISHRTTGVDNTGNICVWDSEKTLAYLLYNHIDAFGFGTGPIRRILELGSGMAGLAAVALAMRIRELSDVESPVQVTLTDGHSDGVQNNQVNQLLTKASLHEGYNGISVSAKVLLWKVHAEMDGIDPQDLVLVSDCTHFHSFHAALAVTTLRSLRIGGLAIFCQPARAESLDNFCRLLQSVPTLSSIEWLQHRILEEQDIRGTETYPDLYDRSLHHPKLMIVRKLRDLTSEDCREFKNNQELRGD